jgi:hypothetical protein
LGRHEANKPRLSDRLARRLDRSFAYRGVSARSSKAKAKSQRSAPMAVVAFLFASGLLMVTVVDPYSGNMVIANVVEAYGPNSPGFPQNFTFTAVQKFEFDRGGFKLVTDGNKTALFVDLAAKPDPGTAKAIAYDYVTSLGWNQAQYSCLVSLWTRESQWKVNAYNAGSGAYGIPQALPGIKMATVGADWQTNPATQIHWGVNYITRRYVTACSALAHSDQFRWY